MREATAAARGDTEQVCLARLRVEAPDQLRMATAPVQSADGQPSEPALPNRATTRQARADELRRARAAAQALRAAYPEVGLLRIELTFADPSSISPAAQVHTLYPAARAFFTYPCPHSDCDGEFELEGAVRTAVGNGTHSTQGSLLCNGARPGEKGSRRSCELQLAYAISADRQSRT